MILRDFMWGLSMNGSRKKALVAWVIIIRAKEEGGTCILKFEIQAQILKM